MATRIRLLACVALALAAASASDIQNLFGPHLSPEAEIFYPSDANWTDSVQQRWSIWAAPVYQGAIKVATVQDVQNVLSIATANNIPFLATAAGHGTALNYGNLHNGIDLDISRFNQASYDSATDLLTIGGAAKFEDVWNALQPHGKEIPTGSAQCVGALGAALGAGIGALQGYRGLMLDVLDSVELVTANGTLMHVSNTSHPDLFWGLKGAGFNFGVVVEAKFRVFDSSYGGNVMEGDMAFPASINESFWEVYKSFDDDANLDPKLSLVAAMSYNKEANATVIVLNANYFGPNETLQRYIKPFIDLKPVKSHFDLVPWNILYKSLFFGNDVTSCQKNLRLVAGGTGMKTTDVPTYVKFTSMLADFAKEYPAINTSFVASRFSSYAPLSVPDHTAAYPYRDIKTHILYEHIYPKEDAGLDSVVHDFIVKARNLFVPTSGYRNLTLYQNYNYGDEGPEVWYSPKKLPRLSALKRKYDPKEQFSFNCPIPLHYKPRAHSW